MQINERKPIVKYHIYVGLNDEQACTQFFDTEKYVSLVEYVCKHNDIAYTLGTVRGGFMMPNGVFVRENSLDIMLINVSETTVEELAAELCAMMRQNCVMITKELAEMYFLSETIG